MQWLESDGLPAKHAQQGGQCSSAGPLMLPSTAHTLAKQATHATHPSSSQAPSSDPTSSQPAATTSPHAHAATHLHHLDHGAGAGLEVVAAAVKGEALAHDGNVALHLACREGRRVALLCWADHAAALALETRPK